MNPDKIKSNKTRIKPSHSIELLRRKSSSNNPKSPDYLFQPIASANDLTNQRKPPSPFQTGLKYLKLLGQLKRQNDTNSIGTQQIKPPIIDRLERTSAFSTNYYAPLSTHLMNKSIQVDDFDDLSYKTASNNNNTNSSLSFYEFFFTFLSLLFFISILLFIQLNSYPIHCLLNKKYWYSNDFSNGIHCENTNIEIHYVQISSLFYQLEIQRNFQATNCLGYNILSCLAINYLLLPKEQIIHRNDALIHHCNSTEQIHCDNHSLSILPYENKWNLKNDQINQLYHCSCLTDLNNTKCFHFMISNQCDLHIPWFDYCLKHSTTHSTCRAYWKKL